MKRRIIRFIVLTFVGICLGVGLGLFLERGVTPQTPRSTQATVNVVKTTPVKTVQEETVQIGADFRLKNHKGADVTEMSWPDQYKLIFFGFTHCFAICPSGLQKMTDVMYSLNADQAKKVQPLFITVDPQRDTVQVMADYLQAFDHRIVGLTGSVEELEKVKEGYRIYARKQEGDSDQFDHSASFYLMSPENEYVTMFSGSASVEEVEKQLAQIITNAEKSEKM